MFSRLNHFLMFFISCSIMVSAQQEIVITNPSFEDIPKQGNNYFSVRGWYDCGPMRFAQESPPDIHPGDFWKVNVPPSHGNTYLGLVVRDNESYEGLSQKLSQPIQPNVCYTFNIDLARSPKYESQSRVTQRMTNYVQPTVLRVWGGNGLCDDKELLAESTPITHQNWGTYEFKIKSKFQHHFILIEAFYKTPVFLPYCGHLLLDNLSNIKEVPCDDVQEEEFAVVVPTKPKNKVLPPHKKGRVDQKKKEESKASNKLANVPQKEKLLKDLDIKKLFKGSTVEIKNLYFNADSARITDNSYEVLDEIYDFLTKHPKIIVEIGGHTNGQPTTAYCDRLSTSRAKSVYTYLLQKGISRNKITYKGYGKRRRIADDQTPEGRKQNQRVEIKVLSVG